MTGVQTCALPIFTVRLPEQTVAGLGGRVAVATFGAIDGTEHLRSWQVTGLPEHYSGSLQADGQTLYLSIGEKGTVILLR